MTEILEGFLQDQVKILKNKIAYLEKELAQAIRTRDEFYSILKTTVDERDMLRTGKK